MENKKHSRGMLGKKHSEETKRKISLTRRGIVPWNKGIEMWKNKKHPHQGVKMWKNKEHPKGMLGKTAWNKGLKGDYVSSEETKKKISENNSRYWKGKSTWIKGKRHSEETKRKIKESNKGQQRSLETKRRIKKARAKQIFPLKDTSIELKIQDFLTTLKIEFVTHKYMNIKNCYQCDIFVPSMNLIIEADGDFFHMNPNKFSSEDRAFKNGMTAKEKWKLDSDRTKELLEKGFKVIRLWENEIIKMKLEDFKEKIKEVKK